MRLISWVLTAALVGTNFLGLIALGAVLMGRARTAAERRTWALRCATSAVGLLVLSFVLCGVSVSQAFSLDGVEPSEKAKQLAMGISDAMNCIAFGVVGSALPFMAAIALVVLARRAAPPS